MKRESVPEYLGAWVPEEAVEAMPDGVSARRRHQSEQPSASEALSESEMADGENAQRATCNVKRTRAKG